MSLQSYFIDVLGVRMVLRPPLQKKVLEVFSEDVRLDPFVFVMVQGLSEKSLKEGDLQSLYFKIRSSIGQTLAPLYEIVLNLEQDSLDLVEQRVLELPFEFAVIFLSPEILKTKSFSLGKIFKDQRRQWVWTVSPQACLQDIKMKKVLWDHIKSIPDLIK